MLKTQQSLVSRALTEGFKTLNVPKATGELVIQEYSLGLVLGLSPPLSL